MKSEVGFGGPLGGEKKVRFVLPPINTALCPVVQLEMAWLASIAANAVEVLDIFLA